MDTYTIDIDLEHYYGERVATGSREACRRLYIRAVSRFNGSELENYLDTLRSYARAYASLSHMLKSPLPHMETPLFLSSLLLVVAGVVMVVMGEQSTLVAAGISAGLVGMLQCARKLVSYWKKYTLREAVFLELAETLLPDMHTDEGMLRG